MDYKVILTHMHITKLTAKFGVRKELLFYSPLSAQKEKAY